MCAMTEDRTTDEVIGTSETVKSRRTRLEADFQRSVMWPLIAVRAWLVR